MKIVVPVKQVAVLDEDFELLPDGTGVDPDFIEWELNEWDVFSVEAALAIRDGACGGDGEVVVVTVGDEGTEDPSLLGCLAMGADRGIRVWDESLESVDVLAVARVLATVVAAEQPDLVLCGVQSSDAVNGATGVAIAGYLELPHVAVGKSLEYDAGTRSLTVGRELEGGTVEIVRLPLPALITIQTGINEPRYATLRAIKQAREKPLAVMGLDELGLDPETMREAAGSQIIDVRMPDRGDQAVMLDGPPSAVASRIAELVEEALKE